MRDTVNIVRCLWNIVKRIPAILRVIWELSVKVRSLRGSLLTHSGSVG